MWRRGKLPDLALLEPPRLGSAAVEAAEAAEAAVAAAQPAVWGVARSMASARAKDLAMVMVAAAAEQRSCKELPARFRSVLPRQRLSGRSQKHCESQRSRGHPAA